MMNKVMLIGHLGKDPELRYTSSGSPVCSFRVATNDSYIDKDGQKVNRVEWHNIVVFGKSAENCTSFLRKGRQVYVEGSVQTRKWQDQQGQDHHKTEIKAQSVLFLGKKDRTDKDSSSYNNWEHEGYPSEVSGMDDVPF